MANTYTQIYIHCVFVVQNRECLISSTWKEELFKYISGIIKHNNHKPLAINGMPDHVHIFVGMKTHQSIADLMQDVKAYSSKWINERKFVGVKFNWQPGYGAFSYSHSQIDKVIKYILNQEKHHKKKTFKEEYYKLLESFEVSYEEKYLFNWIK